MRRWNTSRRTNRTLVPSRSAACSTVNSVSNSVVSSHLRRSCSSRCGRGGQLLPGDASLFACPSGGRKGQPPLPLGLIAGADEHPGGDDHHLVVVLGPAPGIQRLQVTCAGQATVQAGAEALGGLGGVLGDVAGHLLSRQLPALVIGSGDV